MRQGVAKAIQGTDGLMQAFRSLGNSRLQLHGMSANGFFRLTQHFFGAFPLNGKRQLGGNRLRKLQIFIRESVGSVIVNHELTQQDSLIDKWNESHSANAFPLNN